jgi:hypothetical protein
MIQFHKYGLFAAYFSSQLKMKMEIAGCEIHIPFDKPELTYHRQLPTSHFSLTLGTFYQLFRRAA